MKKISDQELRDLVKSNSLQIEKFQAENAKGFQELRAAQAKTDALAIKSRSKVNKSRSEVDKSRGKAINQRVKKD